MKPEISIVIPTYNEEACIQKLYEELAPVLSHLGKECEVIFVDDGSRDGTLGILQKIAKKDRRVKVIKFKRNFGQTAAMLAGFKNAEGEIIVTMDADLQNNPKDIPKLLEKLGHGYDVVCGWRAKRQDAIGKKIASRLSNFLMKHLMHLDIHDSGCTLRAYRKDSVEYLNLYGETHRYIPAIIASQGFRVTEHPVDHRPRTAGKTKYNMSRIPKGFLDLLTLKFLTTYSTRPVHIFGGLGLVSFALGFLGGIYLLYLKFIQGLSIGNRPLLLLTALLLILGVQLILNGFVAELLIRTREAETYKIEKIINKK